MVRRPRGLQCALTHTIKASHAATQFLLSSLSSSQKSRSHSFFNLSSTFNSLSCFAALSREWASEKNNLLYQKPSRSPASVNIAWPVSKRGTLNWNFSLSRAPCALRENISRSLLSVTVARKTGFTKREVHLTEI